MKTDENKLYKFTSLYKSHLIVIMVYTQQPKKLQESAYFHFDVFITLYLVIDTTLYLSKCSSISFKLLRDILCAVCCLNLCLMYAVVLAISTSSCSSHKMNIPALFDYNNNKQLGWGLALKICLLFGQRLSHFIPYQRRLSF